MPVGDAGMKLQERSTTMKRKHRLSHRLPKIMLAAIIAATTIFAGATAMLASTEPAVRYGDLDNDGKVNLHDAQTCLRAALGITDRAPYEKTGDVDGNGKIDLHDCQLILKAALGIINEFPIKKTSTSGTGTDAPEPAESTAPPVTSEEPAPPMASETAEPDASQTPAPPAPAPTGDWYVTFPDHVEIHHPDGSIEIRYYDNRCVHSWEDVMSTRIVKAAWTETEYKTVTEETEVDLSHFTDNNGNQINLTVLYNEYLKSGDYKNETIENSNKYKELEKAIERAIKKGSTREKALASIPATDSYAWFRVYLSNDMIEKYMKLANWEGVTPNGHVVSDPWGTMFDNFETKFMTIEKQVPTGNVINHPAEIEEYVDHYRCTKCGKEVKTCMEKYE